MSRKTQIGWMAVGVMLTLFSVGLTLKMRDGNKALAREEDQSAATKPTEPQPLPPISEATPLPQVKLQAPEQIDPAVVRTSGTEEPTPAGEVRPPTAFAPLPAATPPVAPSPPVVNQPLPPVSVVPHSIMPTPPALPAPVVVTPAPIPPPPPLVVSPGVTPPVITPPPSMPEVKFVPDTKPDFSSPRKEVIPVGASVKQEPGEPPMVVPAGPVQIYQVRSKTETLPDIARRTLGAGERAGDIVRLNPDLKLDTVLPLGATVRLPADACIQEDPDAVKPLPSLRPRTPAAKPKILPLTGTFPCNLDDRKILTLPKGMREQLGNCETLLVSPGPDNCLWITNHAHLERLSERIEQSPAREADVRVFKRLYYAQTEKTPVTAEGRIALSDKLAQFAGLTQELVIVGIDEHFELWDAAHWKQYTQQKSAAARSELAEDE